jgi:hypothetical protein
MEEFSLPTLSTSTNCSACFKQINTDDAFCDACGYPLKGTEEEQNQFIAIRNTKEIDLEAAHKKIREAGKGLYWVAGLTLVSGLIYFFINKSGPLLLVNLILATIFYCLGIWSKSKPLAAIISGLSLYAITIILNAIADPLSILKGIIFKVVIIGLFIKAIKSAIDADKLKKELNVE